MEFVDINEETLCADYADIIVDYGGNLSGEGIVHGMAHCGGACTKTPFLVGVSMRSRIYLVAMAG